MTDYANLYYEVMSFDLKNVGATYQRLRDKIFKGMLDQNVEVYVDEIVVKSDSCEQHVRDLQKVFKAFKDHGMRLNLKKCVFGIKGCRFLGFILTHRGIEANRKQCRAIIEM